MIAYLLENTIHAIDSELNGMLQSEGLEIHRVQLPEAHCDIPKVFTDAIPGIVFLPAFWEDLFCVKVIGELVSLDVDLECVLVGPLPDPELLVSAFNEGCAACLHTPIDMTRLHRVLLRVEEKLKKRVSHTSLIKRVQVLETGRTPRCFNSEDIARDHFLGQVILDIMDRKGPLFEEEVHLLLVSSSPSQQRKLSELLKKVGIQIVEANSLQQAVDCASKKDYHLIISDSVLPGGDVTGLVSELRKQQRKSMPRIVVWSSSPDKAADLLQPENHIDDVLIKPGPETGVESALPTILSCAYQALK